MIGIIGAAALLLIGALTVPMIVGGSSLLFSAGTGGFGCSGSAQQAKSALQSKVSAQAKNSIPSDYLSWYQKVGQQYGVPWVILAGIGTVESDNGRSPACPACTAGPTPSARRARCRSASAARPATPGGARRCTRPARR